MASKELVGRYKQCKHGTRNIVHWLTKTAAAFGGLEIVIKSRRAPLPGGYQAGRHPTTEIEVHSHELTALADLIARSQPRIELPEGVLLILEDVITARRGCAAWYDAQEIDDRSLAAKHASDRGHQAFVKVLEGVRSTLLKARASSAFHVAPGAEKHRPEKLSGIFGGLSLEDPSANPLEEEPEVVLISSDVATTVKVKLEKQADDSDFEIWCFLQDLGDIRQ